MNKIDLIWFWSWNIKFVQFVCQTHLNWLRISAKHTFIWQRQLWARKTNLPMQTHIHAKLSSFLGPLFLSTSPPLSRSSIGGGGYMTQPHIVMINKLVVMVIKLHPFFSPCGRSRLMYLVTTCDDKVSYYPTSRNFKITMNILRNQSDCVQSFAALT